MDETAIEYAIFQRLQADTTLRTLLGKAAAPYGIYKAGQIPLKDPAFPIVTLSVVYQTATTEPHESGVLTLTVTVFGESRRTIHARIQRILRPGRSPITGTDIKIHDVIYNGRGPTLRDDEYRVHYRPDTYLIRYTIFGDIS